MRKANVSTLTFVSGKIFLLLLIVVLVASSAAIVESAVAQSIPKPSVPEVTVKFVRTSYNVTIPSTGETRQIDNNTIDFKIKNQPLTIDENSDLRLFYLIQFKDHNSNKNFSPIYSDETYHMQTTAKYTVLSLTLNAPPILPPLNLSVVDFQVQAQIGHYSQTQKPGPIPGAPVQFQSGDGYTETRFDPIEKSDSSNTLTVNLNETVASPTALQGNSEFPSTILLVILGAAAATLAVAAAVEYRRKKLRNNVGVDIE
jgi:hypothetical protein